MKQENYRSVGQTKFLEQNDLGA